MPKVIAFVLLAAVVIYGLVWLSMRIRAGRDAKPAPLAPDDDPAFLAQLDRRLAEERRQRTVKEAREAQARQERKQAGGQEQQHADDEPADSSRDADPDAPQGSDPAK